MMGSRRTGRDRQLTHDPSNRIAGVGSGGSGVRWRRSRSGHSECRGLDGRFHDVDHRCNGHASSDHTPSIHAGTDDVHARRSHDLVHLDDLHHHNDDNDNNINIHHHHHHHCAADHHHNEGANHDDDSSADHHDVASDGERSLDLRRQLCDLPR